jgi:hypothetical protein
MVYPAGSKTEQPIVDAAAKEIETVLGGHLGVTLVESGDPLWIADPDIEQMKTDYRKALARLVPIRHCKQSSPGVALWPERGSD